MYLIFKQGKIQAFGNVVKVVENTKIPYHLHMRSFLSENDKDIVTDDSNDCSSCNILTASKFKTWQNCSK